MVVSRISHLAVAVAMLSAASTQAMAQDVAEADSGIVDIVVTAEKRVSTGQKTPIAMTVATGDELVKKGVNDVNSLINVAPTLAIAQNNQNTIITIRGVSSRDYTETGNPAVSMSIDNFYLQNGTGLNVGFFDLERIEVLNGPQGTLYGRNSTAGAINIHTAKPTKETEARFSAEYGNKNLIVFEGMGNAPVTDAISVRAAFAVRSREAFRNNSYASGTSFVSKGGNDEDSKAFRLHAAYDNGGAFTGLLSGEYTSVGGVGAVIKGVPYSDYDASTGKLNIGDKRRWELNDQGFINLDIYTVRTNLNYDFGGVTLSYFGGYRKQDIARNNDQDGGLGAHFTFPTSGTTETQNHEIRLASDNDGPFGWQTGVYHFREGNKALTYFNVTDGDFGAAPFHFYTFDYDTQSRSYAAFGQVNYAITPDVKIEVGARYTEEKKTQIGYNNIAGTYSDVNQRYKGNKDTYHVGVNWQATPDNLLYAKFDTGFKAGGFQNGFNYGPETNKAFEIGAKNRFLDRTLQLNLSAFYYDYASLQVQQNDPDTAISRIFNAGKAEIYGGEFDVKYMPTPADTLSFNAAYLHARYKEFAVAEGAVNVSYAGNALPQAPNWALAGGYAHDFYFGDSKITADIQSRYQSRSYFSYRNLGYEQQKSYTKTDFTLTYAPEDKTGLSISAYVRNIEDSTILSAAEEASYAGGYLVQFQDPRTYGVRVNYNW